MHDTSAPTTGAPTFDVRLAAHEIADALADDVRRGLSTAPKSLPPKWFYDERGSRLFDAITRLPEYYPTEAEREILLARAAEIVDAAGADTVVELGSGTSDKTRALLDAATEAGSLERFVPFDVSEATLRDAAAQLGDRYPGLRIHGVVGDFDHHLDALPRDGRRLVLFLGGTIGNFTPAGRRRLLDQLCGELQPGDTLLLGTDLVKPASRLIPAYDDAAGVTAEFNRNVLHVINRELDADFAPERFEHEARWNSDAAWVEMHLVAKRPERVRIAKLDMEVTFAAGESIHTEISAKFRLDQVTDELARVGMATMAQWTDEAGEFAVTLAKRTVPARPSAPAPAR
ncbi:MAG: L-histidine N(alpha)-methyltransferase [Acidimicrobiia bacterium]